MTEMHYPDGRDSYPAARLFALSFMALFLELITIRWVPSVVPLVAYYGNLMLISSFLGLGLGAMLAGRRRDLIGWFPSILVLDVIVLLLCRGRTEVASGTEIRFNDGGSIVGNAIALLGAFVLNVLLFVPIGQVIGRLFRSQPPLRAYMCDLLGSLCGTLAFGFFSLKYFSPAIGFAIVAAIFVAVTRGWQRWLNLPVLGVALLIIPHSTSSRAIWSPYYYVTVSGVDSQGKEIDVPPPSIHTMIDPPVYKVAVNTNFYQMDATLNPGRYSPGPRTAQVLRDFAQYFVPYRLHPKAQTVCIVGAGGGIDVEAALMSGVSRVDAVEIDPTLIQIARRFNPSPNYEDPRVHLYNNDARAFFQTARGGYDLVIFGLLDSHALFSYANSIRLDGYIYTVESIRKAFSLLEPDGMLSITFLAERRWLVDKLRAMVREATGREPLDYADNPKGVQIFCVFKGDALSPPPTQVDRFQRNDSITGPVDVPTDDWPYLYLQGRTIPGDYLAIIGCLVAISIAMVLGLRRMDPGILHGRAAISEEGIFFFLGAGFLLLETRSIDDCALYFGTTWFVTLVVVSGVLINVLAANLLAMRLKRPAIWAYGPVLLSLAMLYHIPREWVLGLPWASRLLWSIFVVPLPIFFAGLIFSTTFRESKSPAIVFGANLIGATVGGFFEYAGMALGTRSLLLFVMASYVLSLACVMAWRRGAKPDPELATSNA